MMAQQLMLHEWGQRERMHQEKGDGKGVGLNLGLPRNVGVLTPAILGSLGRPYERTFAASPLGLSLLSTAQVVASNPPPYYRSEPKSSPGGDKGAMKGAIIRGLAPPPGAVTVVAAAAERVATIAVSKLTNHQVNDGLSTDVVQAQRAQARRAAKVKAANAQKVLQKVPAAEKEKAAIKAEKEAMRMGLEAFYTEHDPSKNTAKNIKKVLHAFTKEELTTKLMKKYDGVAPNFDVPVMDATSEYGAEWRGDWRQHWRRQQLGDKAAEEVDAAMALTAVADPSAQNEKGGKHYRSKKLRGAATVTEGKATVASDKEVSAALAMVQVCALYYSL
jgi:hypothetical protein